MSLHRRARRFVDTNVLVHAVDTGQPEKQAVARALLEARAADLVVSAHALSGSTS